MRQLKISSWLNLGFFPRLCFLILPVTILACVQLNLVPPPAAPLNPTATLWPTVSARPTPTLVSVKPIFSPVQTAACLMPSLAVAEHIAASGSYTETERSASTPMLCHIKRNTCAYQNLVGIIDDSMIFKQEEEIPYQTEDILMHPAMILPLSRLNRLVQTEWGGAYQLRITDAYDSLLEHDPPDSEPSRRYSLHYEGRAIDLTLWPVERDLYDRLCALAHCAGFDWVHNEGSHCHASINAESLCTRCAQ